MENLAENQVDLEENDNHYFNDFSNDELYEVIEKKDEWSNYDFALAKRLLLKRGEILTDETFLELEQRRQTELAKPEEAPRFLILVGYIFAVLGGLLGLIIGFSLWDGKKTLSDGSKVFTYTIEQRKHGGTIIIISIAVSLLISIYYFMIKG